MKGGQKGGHRKGVKSCNAILLIYTTFMARPLRLEFSGALYHVTSRGDRQEAIFLTDNDRLNWLQVFKSVCKRFNWLCHSYCLMDNHYHILVETIEGNLSKGMRQLNGVYTQRFNRTHKRVGHVYQGRYKAILVDKDSYLLELSRYVVLNPVRAGMVKSAGAWPWSSYRGMVGRVQPPVWLHTDSLLSLFGKQRKRAVEKYIDFICRGIGLPSVWQDLKNQIFLGDEAFISTMQNKIETSGDMKEIPKAQHRPLAKPLSYYAKSYKNPRDAMAMAFLTGAYTMKAIADEFAVHYSTVSRAVK